MLCTPKELDGERSSARGVRLPGKRRAATSIPQRTGHLSNTGAMQGPVYTHSRLSVFSTSSQSSIDLVNSGKDLLPNDELQTGLTVIGTRPSSSTGRAITPTQGRPVSVITTSTASNSTKRSTTIYERNLNKTRNAEVSLSAWAFMFSEVVQYTQKRVSGIGDLERR